MRRTGEVTSGEFYLFVFGTVCFWDMAPQQERKVLMQLQRCVRGMAGAGAGARGQGRARSTRAGARAGASGVVGGPCAAPPACVCCLRVCSTNGLSPCLPPPLSTAAPYHCPPARFEEGKLPHAKVESDTFRFALVPYSKPSIQAGDALQFCAPLLLCRQQAAAGWGWRQVPLPALQPRGLQAARSPRA